MRWDNYIKEKKRKEFEESIKNSEKMEPELKEALLNFDKPENDTEPNTKSSSHKKEDANIKNENIEENKYTSEELKTRLQGLLKFKTICDIEGYTKLPDRILYPLIQSNLNPATKMICLYLFKRTWGYQNKKSSKLSYQDIIEATNLSKSVVSKSMKKLENHHIISLEKIKGTNQMHVYFEINVWKWRSKNNIFKKGIDYFLKIKSAKIAKKVFQ